MHGPVRGAMHLAGNRQRAICRSCTSFEGRLVFEWGGGVVQGTLKSGSCCGLVIDESDGSQTMYVGRPAFFS